MEPKRKNTSKHVQVCNLDIFLILFFLRHQIKHCGLKKERHGHVITQITGEEVEDRLDSY